MSRGEGIVGLTSAFLFAGSDSVVASLWNVNDESTSRFMQFFYQGLHSGLSKAEALRVARNELMNTRITSPETQEEEDLSSPYFWAPFILVGGWK
jgi:CHAT domain-containing protein